MAPDTKPGPFSCGDCGRKFPFFIDPSPTRAQCLKCERVEAAGEDKVAVDTIEVRDVKILI